MIANDCSWISLNKIDFCKETMYVYIKKPNLN